MYQGRTFAYVILSFHTSTKEFGSINLLKKKLKLIMKDTRSRLLGSRYSFPIIIENIGKFKFGIPCMYQGGSKCKKVFVLSG